MPTNSANSLLTAASESADGSSWVAQSQKARSLELRAAADLARLHRDQGRFAEARNLLAPIYNWFTEGFDTQDLKRSKGLARRTIPTCQLPMTSSPSSMAVPSRSTAGSASSSNLRSAYPARRREARRDRHHRVNIQGGNGFDPLDESNHTTRAAGDDGNRLWR